MSTTFGNSHSADLDLSSGSTNSGSSGSINVSNYGSSSDGDILLYSGNGTEKAGARPETEHVGSRWLATAGTGTEILKSFLKLIGFFVGADVFRPVVIPKLSEAAES